MDTEKTRAAIEQWKALTELQRAVDRDLMDAIAARDWDRLARVRRDAAVVRKEVDSALERLNTCIEAAITQLNRAKQD